MHDGKRLLSLQRACLAAFLSTLLCSSAQASTDCLSQLEELTPVAFGKVPPARLHASWCACYGAAVDVVRGSIGTLEATGGDYRAATERCLFDTLSGVYEFDDAQVPSPGEGYWYLLRLDQDGGCPEGTGTYDSLNSLRQVQSRDVEIGTSGHDCGCYLTNPGECYGP